MPAVGTKWRHRIMGTPMRQGKNFATHGIFPNYGEQHIDRYLVNAYIFPTFNLEMGERASQSSPQAAKSLDAPIQNVSTPMNYIS